MSTILCQWCKTRVDKATSIHPYPSSRKCFCSESCVTAYKSYWNQRYKDNHSHRMVGRMLESNDPESLTDEFVVSIIKNKVDVE